MISVKFIRWILALAILPGFAGIWKLQHCLDAQRVAIYQEQDDLLLRSDKLVKVMSLEYAPFIADLYWTQAVQYYGAKQVKHDTNVQLLWPLLDLATTLDPNLIVAYRFGSTFLAERPPRGAGRPDLAIELLSRGIRENPNEWRLYEDLGFVYYFSYGDYVKASDTFLEGSMNPDALPWMRVMAGKMAEQGQSRATSAFLWNEIYQSAKNPDMKKNALVHLQLLRAEDDCEHLNLLADEYQKRFGHRPAAMRDLVNAGLLHGLPVDPLDFAYIFDADGKAQFNPASPLLIQRPMYQKPLTDHP